MIREKTKEVVNELDGWQVFKLMCLMSMLCFFLGRMSVRMGWMSASIRWLSNPF